MTLHEYQSLAKGWIKRDGYPAGVETPEAREIFDRLIWTVGLTGEAGEVAEYIKKVIGHGHAFDRAKLIAELGDVLWYLAALSQSFGITLEEVALANLEKLATRYPDGFSSERSKNR